ncbi:phosphate/phosphite/phosphonate ABC transporter substrate-binding protein [Emcibacter nanhaiensis]|uniref:Phosphate/phosphite/phosphonate ABC transporter substrate-binding protein n=1 Tax=Emcibacter nanhaiensis TaxID=1505037 RepID=A0A501PH64_9PROT|nr:phosphate/phosphite/phosphonate ABC transporter substrate-binding protein [Emcibacter nanhaiensis]TPD59800.1 phosphate/phosphite/phosphonate ABC transporter substrate-binding protein [Emcibacter nanhaiensis]
MLSLSFAAKAKEEFVIASISEKPSEEVKKFKKLAEHLQESLEEFGYTRSRVFIARDTEAVAKAFRDGVVDIFMDSPLVVEKVNDLADSKTVLRRWKKGTAHYHSVIFTLRDSPIEALPDLVGKTIAFDDPASTTGHIMPRILFQDEGLPLKEARPGENDDFGSDAVNFFFSGHDENTLTWVLHQRADAGAMSNIKLERLSNADMTKLKIISRSRLLPRHAVTVSPHLSDDATAKIINVLTTLDLTKEGRKILKKAEKTTKFDIMPPSETTYIRELYVRLKDSSLNK